MFEFLPESQGRYVAVKAVGKLTDEAYKEFVPKLEAIIAEHGPVRVLFDMTMLEGWTLKAAMDDMMLGLKHGKDFERIALVGDEAWEALAAGMANAFMNCEVRHFLSVDRQIAWDFILDID